MQCVSRQSDEQPSSFFPASKIGSISFQARKDSEGVIVESAQFPLTREVLWDRSPQGTPEFLHLTAKRNLRLFVNEKTLKLAARHLQTKSSFDGFLIGSVTVDPEEDGTILTVDRFDPGRETTHRTGAGSDVPRKVPTTIVPGDHIIPLKLVSGLAGAEHSLTHSTVEFTRTFSAIQGCMSSKEPANTSQLLMFKARIHCHRDEQEVIFNLHFGAVTMATCIQATPVNVVPIIPTALARNLTGPLRLSDLQGKPKCGYLTMDHTRKLLLLLESDPKAYSLPLMGIWVSGVFSIHHPYVWACCLRFLHSRAIEERVTVPANGFLLLHYSPAQTGPDFLECAPTKEQPDSHMFELHSCYDNLHLDMSGSRSLEPICFDLLPAPDGPTRTSFIESLSSWMKENKRLNSSSKEYPIQPSNSASMHKEATDEDPIPRPSPSPHPQGTQVPFVLPTVPEVSLCLSFEDSPQNRPAGNQGTDNSHGKNRNSSQLNSDSPQLLAGKENDNPLVRYSYSESPFAQGRNNAKQAMMLSDPQLADSREPLKPILNTSNKPNFGKPGRHHSVKSRQELIAPQGNNRPVDGRQKSIHEDQRLVIVNRHMSNHQQTQVNQRQRAINKKVPNKECDEDSHKQDSREMRVSHHERVPPGQGRGVVFVVDKGDERHPRQNPGLRPISLKDDHKIQEQRGRRRSTDVRARDRRSTERANHRQQCVDTTKGQGNGNTRRISNENERPNQNGRVPQQSGWVSQQSLGQNDSGFTSTDHIVASPSQGPYGPLACNRVSEKRQDVNKAIPSQMDAGFHGNPVQQRRDVCIASRRRGMQETDKIRGEEQKEPFLVGATDPRVSFPKADLLRDDSGSLPTSQTQQQRNKQNQEIDVEESGLTALNQNASKIDYSSHLGAKNQHVNSFNSHKGVPEDEQDGSDFLPAGEPRRPDPYELLMRQEMQLKQLQEQIQLLLQQQDVPHPPPPSLLITPRTPASSIKQSHQVGLSQFSVNTVSTCTNTGASLVLLTPMRVPGKVSAATSPMHGTPVKGSGKKSAATSPIKEPQDRGKSPQETSNVHKKSSTVAAKENRNDNNHLGQMDDANCSFPQGDGEDMDADADLTSRVLLVDDDPSQTITSSLHAVDIHSFHGSPDTTPQGRTSRRKSMEINSLTSPVLGESASVILERPSNSSCEHHTRGSSEQQANDEPAQAASLLFRNERQFYDNLLSQVKVLLDEQVNEKGSDESEQTTGSPHEHSKSSDVTCDRGSTLEDVAMATIQELERIKTRSSNEVEDHSELQDFSHTASGFLHRSVSLSAISDYPRINYVSLSMDDTFDFDLLSDADRITLKYLSDEQRKELPKLFNHRTRNRTVRFDSLPTLHQKDLHRGRRLSASHVSEVEFSLNNLSIATKEYLEKYNLMGKRAVSKERDSCKNSEKRTNFVSPKSECTAPPPTPEPGTADSSGSNVLDMKKLRNLPKLF